MSVEEINNSNKSLKEKLYLFIENTGNVSFADILEIKGTKGDCNFELKDEGYSNVLLWQGLTKEAIDGLTGLVNEGKIAFKPTTLLVYLMDGRYLNLPMAEKKEHYKELRWLPVVMNVNKNK